MESVEKWNRDLKDGEKGERLFAEWMKQFGWVFKEKGYDKKWDLILERKKKRGSDELRRVSFEVKTDRWEKFNWETGNIFIETSCSGKPSGISTTEAEMFIYFFPEREEVYTISVFELKELMNTRGDLFFRSEQSGDGGRVVGSLCKRDVMIRNGFRVHKIKRSSEWD